MDILKIRNKKKREDEAKAKHEPPAPAPSSSVVEPEPPQAAAPPAPAPPRPTPKPAPEPRRTPSLPPPTRKAASAGDKAVKKEHLLEATEAGEAPLILDDPLLEFLARYDEGADQMLVASSPEGPRDESKRYLAFDLAGEEYAASIMDIREILRVLALTAVPRAPREILGVLSKRGLVMPVIDLAASLGLREPERAWSQRQRILVVGEGDRVCGLRVDRVLEVVRLSAHDVEEVPASLGSRSRHQLRGLGRVGERMFILLDVQAVLHAMAVGAGLEAREEVA